MVLWSLRTPSINAFVPMHPGSGRGEKNVGCARFENNELAFPSELLAHLKSLNKEVLLFLLIVEFVKKIVYLGAHYSERPGLMGLIVNQSLLISFTKKSFIHSFKNFLLSLISTLTIGKKMALKYSSHRGMNEKKIDRRWLCLERKRFSILLPNGVDPI